MADPAGRAGGLVKSGRCYLMMPAFTFDLTFMVISFKC